MNKLCVLLGLLILWSPSVGAETPPQPTSSTTTPSQGSNRLHDFVYASILSPGPYVLAFGAALIDETARFPDEWTGGEGFGKRNLARLGTGFASDVIGHSLGAALRHRVLYEPCGCRGGWRRTKHAISRGFMTRHENGELVMHASVFAAKLGAAGIANAFYPTSYSGSDVARETIAGIGVNALLNIAREFGPELQRLVEIR